MSNKKQIMEVFLEATRKVTAPRYEAHSTVAELLREVPREPATTALQGVRLRKRSQ